MDVNKLSGIGTGSGNTNSTDGVKSEKKQISLILMEGNLTMK